ANIATTIIIPKIKKKTEILTRYSHITLMYCENRVELSMTPKSPAFNNKFTSSALLCKIEFAYFFTCLKKGVSIFKYILQSSEKTNTINDTSILIFIDVKGSNIKINPVKRNITKNNSIIFTLF